MSVILRYKRDMLQKLLFFLILCTSSSFACEQHHYFSVGPEIYKVKREREGGTRQKGTLYGARLRYDYLNAWRPYIGGEAAVADGILRGRNGSGDRLHSDFLDHMVEGRLGFTLQSYSGCKGWITPFAGGGYVWEKNNFIPPSSKCLHFRNYYGYFALGCLAGVPLFCNFELGLRATARFSIKGKVKITHGEEEDEMSLKYEQKVHCRVGIPLTYWFNDHVYFSLEPFYEYRHYGRRNAFPFDFLDTRIKAYGADFFFIAAF